MRKIYLLSALTLAATLLAASPVLAASIPISKTAVRSGEIAPDQACQQMVASASASATTPVQDQNAASPEPIGRVKTLLDTGGSPLVSLAAGVLLMGGGLLLRRISH
jgi:hypothetical protein